MKCERCQRNIALAKRCPYCGKVQVVDREETSSEHRGRERPRRDEDGTTDEDRARFRGAFQGQVNGGDRTPGHDGRASQPLTFLNVLRYLLDPNVPGSRKWVIYGAIFYILSPLDILPGFIFGPLGWLDDIAVLIMALRWLKAEINRMY